MKIIATRLGRELPSHGLKILRGLYNREICRREPPIPCDVTTIQEATRNGFAILRSIRGDLQEAEGWALFSKKNLKDFSWQVELKKNIDTNDRETEKMKSYLDHLEQTIRVAKSSLYPASQREVNQEEFAITLQKLEELKSSNPEWSTKYAKEKAQLLIDLNKEIAHTIPTIARQTKTILEDLSAQETKITELRDFLHRRRP